MIVDGRLSPRNEINLDGELLIQFLDKSDTFYMQNVGFAYLYVLFM